LVSKSQRAAQRDSVLEAVNWLETWTQIRITAENVADVLAPYCADDTHAQHLLDELLQTLSLLRAYGIDDAHMVIQPDLARTWDYYTGIVFELTTTDGIDLGGGGRYDELMRLLGGQNTPSVGFAYYLDNIAPLVDADTEQHARAFKLSGQDIASVLWAQVLRARGIAVALVMDGAQADAVIDPQQRLIWQDTA
jgi:histidyl-tRNA synthetase